MLRGGGGGGVGDWVVGLSSHQGHTSISLAVLSMLVYFSLAPTALAVI